MTAAMMASSFARMRALPSQQSFAANPKATSSTAFSTTAPSRPATATIPEPDCCPEICPVCSTSSGAAPTPCLRCKSVFYCSARHRDAHAFQHRSVCERLRAKRSALDQAHQARGMSDTAPIMARLATTSAFHGAGGWEDSSTEDERDDGGPPAFGPQSRFSGAFGATARHRHENSNCSSSSNQSNHIFLSPHRPATVAESAVHSKSQPSVVGGVRHQYSRPMSGMVRPHPPAVAAASHTTPPRGGFSTRMNDMGGLEVNGGEEDYVKELGRASWHVMHCMAERFPQIPTRQEQEAAIAFLNGFGMLYPCTKCRRHFREILRSHPPDTSSRQGFVQWMEFFHDQVNLILGKPTQRH